MVFTFFFDGLTERKFDNHVCFGGRPGEGELASVFDFVVDSQLLEGADL